MKNIFKLSFIQKIVTFVLAAMTISLSIIGSMFYFNGERIILDNRKRVTVNKVREIASFLKKYYQNAEIDLKSFAYMSEKINQGKSSKTNKFYLQFKKKSYTSFLVFKKDTYKTNLLYKKQLLNIKDSDLKSNSFFITDIHKKSSKFAYQWIIYLSKKNIFLLKINILEMLSQVFIQDILDEFSDSIIILNKKGQYLYSPLKEESFAFEKGVNANIFRDALGVESYIKELKDFKYQGHIYGNEHFLFLKHISLNENRFHLYLGLGFDIQSKISKYTTLKRQIILLSLTMMILLIFIVYFIAQDFSRSLENIERNIAEYTAGNLDVDFLAIKDSNLTKLTYVLHRMVQNLNDRIKLQIQQEQELRITRDAAESSLKEKNLLFERLNHKKDVLENLTKEKDDLLAIVSHDLKNPLSIIDVSMDILLEDCEINLSESYLDLIKRSKKSTQMSLKLITDLLDLARYEGGMQLELSNFNVYDMVKTSCEMLELKLEDKKIDLFLEIPPSFFINADFNRMSQIIHNVVGNAIKYTPVSGIIKIIATSKDSSLMLEIVDNGAGIPSEKIEDIFKKFTQARSSDKQIGTGLGLTICQTICNMHNGTIYVNSIEKEGSTFVITIPGLIIKEEQRKIILPKKETNKTVLVIDDEEDIRLIISEALIENEFSVFQAMSSKEAQYLISKNKIDFIIVDFQLADEDCIHFLKKIQKDSSIPAIIISGYLNTFPDKLLKKLNVIHFLNKPFDVFKLGSLIFDFFQTNSLTEKREQDIHNEMSVKKAKSNDDVLYNVLFVDDSDDIVNLIKILLKKEKNIKLEIAQNGLEAVEKVEKEKYDFVIMDDQMPEMTGTEAIFEIIKKGLKKETIYISMSANNTELDQKKYKDAGFDFSLGKPITKSKILKLIYKK